MVAYEVADGFAACRLQACRTPLRRKGLSRVSSRKTTVNATNITVHRAPPHAQRRRRAGPPAVRLGCRRRPIPPMRSTSGTSSGKPRPRGSWCVAAVWFRLASDGLHSPGPVVEKPVVQSAHDKVRARPRGAQVHPSRKPYPHLYFRSPCRTPRGSPRGNAGRRQLLGDVFSAEGVCRRRTHGPCVDPSVRRDACRDHRKLDRRISLPYGRRL